jgi:hypothetical protein
MKLTPPKPAVPVSPQVRRTAEDISAQTKNMVDSFKQSEKAPEAEFIRVPFGSAQSQLDAVAIEGYHLHWINDWHPQFTDRITQAQQAGYRFVTQQETETARLLGASTADLGGARVSRTVGTRPSGEPITAYLMKIPTEWWLDHQKGVWDHADKVDQAIRRGAAGAKIDGGYNPTSDPIKLVSKLQQGDSE